jgi:hypothetical protein
MAELEKLVAKPAFEPVFDQAEYALFDRSS